MDVMKILMFASLYPEISVHHIVLTSEILV